MPALEIVTTTVFIYVLFSLVVTVVTGLISLWLGWQQQILRRSIRGLLDSNPNDTWTEKLYEHPLIQSLGGKHGPSSIPSRTFAVALLDVIKDTPPNGQVALEEVRRAIETTPNVSSTTDFKNRLRNVATDLPDQGPLGDMRKGILAFTDRIPERVWLNDAVKSAQDYWETTHIRWIECLIGNLQSLNLKRALRALLGESCNDLERLKANIETWFNNSMTKEIYETKLRTAYLLLAFVVTISFNVDTLLIIRSFWSQKVIEQSLISELKSYCQPEISAPLANAPAATADSFPSSTSRNPNQFDHLFGQLNRLDFPVGWILPGEPSYDPTNRSFRNWPGFEPTHRPLAIWIADWWDTIRFHFLGWLITVFLVSLGGPFWLAMLGKVMNLSSPGKSADEKSKTG